MDPAAPPDSTPAVAVTWVLTCAAVVLMALRLVLRRLRRQRWLASDGLTVAAALCAVARAGLTYCALVGGTSAAVVDAGAFTAAELSQRETGSKLALAATVVHCT